MTQMLKLSDKHFKGVIITIVNEVKENMLVMSEKKKEINGNSLAVQWLGLHTSTAGGTGSIPGWGTRTLYAVWHGQKKKKREREQRSENKISRASGICGTLSKDLTYR